MLHSGTGYLLQCCCVVAHPVSTTGREQVSHTCHCFRLSLPTAVVGFSCCTKCTQQCCKIESKGLQACRRERREGTRTFSSMYAQLSIVCNSATRPTSLLVPLHGYRLACFYDELTNMSRMSAETPGAAASMLCRR